MGNYLRRLVLCVVAALCAIPLGGALAGDAETSEVGGPSLPAEQCPEIVAAFEEAKIAPPEVLAGQKCPSLGDANDAIAAFQQMATERAAFEAGLEAQELGR
jgi:hypothetical protein